MTEPRYNLRSNKQKLTTLSEIPIEVAPPAPETNCIMWSYILYVLRILLPFLFKATEDLTLTQTKPINRVDSNLDYSSSGSDGEYEKRLVADTIHSMRTRADTKQATKFILYKFATNGILHLEKINDETVKVSFTTESNRAIPIPPNIKICMFKNEEEKDEYDKHNWVGYCEPTDDYSFMLITKHYYSIKYNNEEILHIESPTMWDQWVGDCFRVSCINYL